MNRGRRLVVILAGPPGSGKTTIGRCLQTEFGYDFEDREAAMLERWGSRKEFRRHRDEALAEIHREFVQRAGTPGPPLVFETTALTERPFVEQLQREANCFTVVLTVSLEVALGRIASRQQGRNFTNDEEANRSVWEAFQQARTTLLSDLSLDSGTTTAESLAREIEAAVKLRLARLTDVGQDQRG